jgi:hypothetical protein
MLIFAEGGKPEKNPRSKGENQQTTHDTEVSGIEPAGHSGERQALSPLRHPRQPYCNATARHVATDIVSLQRGSSTLIWCNEPPDILCCLKSPKKIGLPVDEYLTFAVYVLIGGQLLAPHTNAK